MAKKKIENKKKKDDSFRNLMLAILILVVFFALIIVGYNTILKPNVKTINDLHLENIEGKLDPEDGYMYSGFSFVRVNDRWYTQVLPKGATTLYNIELRYSPYDLELVPVEGDVGNFLNMSWDFGNRTYLTFDPTEENLSYVALAAADITTTLRKVEGIHPTAACTKNDTDACKGAPIVDCSYKGAPIIYINQGNLTAVKLKDNCLVIQGRGLEILKATDKVFLIWHGIMS